MSTEHAQQLFNASRRLPPRTVEGESTGSASYHPSMAERSLICICVCICTLALASACSRSPPNERGERGEPTKTSPNEPRLAVQPRPWESAEATAELARAPDQTSCAKDDDCIPFHGSGTSPPAVCCDGSTTGITTRSYARWVEAFRAKYCAGAQCQTPSLPGALPADCFFEGRCVNGRCATACDTR